jgi:antitoxin (DNA-binding transcriptional repressor) of toxin-antitoxin stability system
MRDRRVGIQELKAGLDQCLEEVRKGTTLVVTDGEQQVARLVPERGTERIRGRARIEWSGQRLEKRKPKARLRGGAQLSDIIRENRN